MVLLTYLDYNSTTPTDKRVVDAMMPVFTEYFGNPSSTHNAGAHASDLIKNARGVIANLIGANPSDVVFTSSATEANNMAIVNFAHATHTNRRILYGATEHKSVIETCRSLSGVSTDTVSVCPNGVINLDTLKKNLTMPTDLVSIMMANSETGVINPIKEISDIVHNAGAILHSDITQAVGKIPVNMDELGIDIATCSSHKLYGPKGCGALIAPRQIRKNMSSFLYGGGQEQNLRSGTENVPGIVGFAKACEITNNIMHDECVRIENMRNSFEEDITTTISEVTINGKDAKRLPNTSNIRIKGALADAVINNARELEISSGSACSSSTIEPSHVLLAMGLDRTAADESIRISIGRYTTIKDVKMAVVEIAKAVDFVRKMNSDYGEKIYNVAH